METCGTRVGKMVDIVLWIYHFSFCMKMVLFTEKVGQNCLTFVAVIVPESAKQVKMCHNLPSFE